MCLNRNAPGRGPAEALLASPKPDHPAQGAAANPAAYTLIHHVGGQRTALFKPTCLMKPVTYLGRLGANDVVLTSDNVSRRHVKLIVSEAGVTAHDLDSHNGVFLNGKKVRSTHVNFGDLLYVGDVCIELKRTDKDAFAAAATLARAQRHDEITGEDEPTARSLAALVRATEIIGAGDDETYPVEVVEVCRELCEATVAALVLQNEQGTLEAPVVLQPESGRRAGVPVLWPVVTLAMDQGRSQFSADLKRTPLVADDSVVKSDVGALMVVPIIVAGRIEGALYLARQAPSPLFSERELETVGAIAANLGLRRRTLAPPAAPEALVEPHGDALAAQAKAEAAELRLQAAQEDIRTLTERLHSLEGEQLKLKQRLEIEKQSAVDARREADRGRNEASKLEQGLHKTDEDVKKLRDALTRSEDERAKLRDNVRLLDEERRSKSVDIERLKENVHGLEAERDALRVDGEVTRQKLAEAANETRQLGEEIERTRASLEAALAEAHGAAEAYRAAVRMLVPESTVEQVEAVATGAPAVTEVAQRAVAALVIELRGLDLWAGTAAPAEVQARASQFCEIVAMRVRANGGRVEQVLGHTHLVLFAADTASVRAAVRCALEISALCPAEHGIGVACGLHVSPSASGFLGGPDGATRVEMGEAVHVARALIGMSFEPVFLITDAAQQLIAGDPTFAMLLVGPAVLPSGPRALLYRVGLTQSGAG